MTDYNPANYNLFRNHNGKIILKQGNYQANILSSFYVQTFDFMFNNDRHNFNPWNGTLNNKKYIS